MTPATSTTTTTAALKDDYTARAARSIRAIEAHRTRVASARPRRSWPRTMAVLAGVVAFALVAGVLVARFCGPPRGRRRAHRRHPGVHPHAARQRPPRTPAGALRRRHRDLRRGARRPAGQRRGDGLQGSGPDRQRRHGGRPHADRRRRGRSRLSGHPLLPGGRSPSPVATTRRSRSSTGSTRSIRPPTSPPRPTTCARRSRRFGPRPRRRRPPPGRPSNVEPSAVCGGDGIDRRDVTGLAPPGAVPGQTQIEPLGQMNGSLRRVMPPLRIRSISGITSPWLQIAAAMRSLAQLVGEEQRPVGVGALEQAVVRVDPQAELIGQRLQRLHAPSGLLTSRDNPTPHRCSAIRKPACARDG